MQQAANRIASAEKQMAEAVKEGHSAIANSLAGAVPKERAELGKLIEKHREEKAEMASLSGELNKLTPATIRYTTAVTGMTGAAVKVTDAHQKMVPAVAAASAEIRLFEGVMPIRAVEQFT